MCYCTGPAFISFYFSLSTAFCLNLLPSSAFLITLLKQLFHSRQSEQILIEVGEVGLHCSVVSVKMHFATIMVARLELLRT